MPKADRTRNTSNRSALTPEGRWPPKIGVPGIPAPKPPPLPDWLLVPAKPDEKSLGELCTQFRTEFSAYCDAMEGADYEPSDDLMGRSISRREELLSAIIAKQATTIDELKAKASVMLAYAKVMGVGDQVDRLLATSIAQDLVLSA